MAWETASIYDKTSRYRDPEWVYGFPELDNFNTYLLPRDGIARATRVANPGCYPTAALLGLLPSAFAVLATETTRRLEKGWAFWVRF